MRWRPLTWFLLSIFCFVGAVYFWRLGDSLAARKAAAKLLQQPARQPKPATRAQVAPFHLLSQPGTLNSLEAQNQNSASGGSSASPSARFTHRLSNTAKTVGQLSKSDRAILLANALLDTEKPLALAIPEQLRAKGVPGSYVVQARGPLNAAFRATLGEAGATIISYIPNNAYLVRASEAVARELQAAPGTQAVLPYEPYYKLQRSLLALAVAEQPLPENSVLNALIFADGRDATLAQLQALGVEVLSEERSPFGPLLKVRPPADSLAALAGLSGVQALEPARARASANDLSRATVGVAVDTVTTSNYFGLTGTGVVVAVSDSGVDRNHPDLQGNRVTGDFPASLVDTSGHGTHVAGIIAGNGAESWTVTNAQGSINPGTNGQFRGMAPRAHLFSMSLDNGAYSSDAYLQETAARNKALISNNSWNYGSTEYDLAAASYDQAVRDALPGVTGSQPVLFVFSAGNIGGGSDDGSGGNSDSIESPGTAKNVITVGAIEQPRNISNQTWICTSIAGTNFCTTNQPWLPSTDSSNQVAGFSSRGNVGVGIEGDAGRFKPDLVAPGTFVVSTRSEQWDQAAYYNPTNYQYNFITDQVVAPTNLQAYSIFVPANTVQLIIQVFASNNIPLPIYVKQSEVPTTNSYDILKTNLVSIPPDGTLSPVDTYWAYAIGNSTNTSVIYSIETTLVITNNVGNYFEVFSNLNNSIGSPSWYRYESGTSMSAADVSGILALMQNFFAQQSITPSPALMKALLINGARTVADRYSMQVDTSLNSQGWGLVSLPTSLPGSPTTTSNEVPTSMLYFDQSPSNALATGQSQTYYVSIDPASQEDQPLRFTLVWTDPPGNPVASTKLVNDLDLVVTNMDTLDVYYGNDIPPGSDFNQFWDTNTTPNIDTVNNVENVFLSTIPPLGSNYSVTVFGHHVNVNAVTAQPGNVVQDYALVISAGSNALTVLNINATSSQTEPLVTVMTNGFPASSIFPTTGGMLLGQHAGANTQLQGTNTVAVSNTMPTMGTTSGQLTIGMTNQWHFYVLTNDQGYTNAAFLTFLPPTLAIPQMGVREATIANATTPEADIDLYVSTDPGLINLHDDAVAAAYKSLSRGGTETIVLSNAVPHGVYYVGVKAEDQQAAEYGFLGVFSQNPFSQDNGQGDQTLQGFPVPAQIPDGSPAHPGGTYIFAICPQPMTVQKVVVTNTITHQLVTDLFGELIHSGNYAVLNNHSGSGGVTNFAYVYDDSSQNDTPGSQHTDGPGTLQNFAGQPGVGQWMLAMIDNAPGNVGTNDNLVIFLSKQQDLKNGFFADILAHSCRDDYIYVPPEATNLTVRGVITVGGGTVTMQVCPVSGGACAPTITLSGATNSVVIDKSIDPLLNAGLYVVHTCNQGASSVTVYLIASLGIDVRGITPLVFTSAGPVPILDDAVTYSSIDVTNHNKIVSVDVGVRIDHPRVSDLALTLISPDGTRILLDENRGGSITSGMGTNLSVTSMIPVSSSGGPEASTNSIDTGQTSGTLTIAYNFYTIPDTMAIYYGGVLLTNTGFISGTGTFTVDYSGTSTIVDIVMNQGGSPYPTTAWDYTVSAPHASYLYFTFTENTNRTITPIKFFIPPFGVLSAPITTNFSDFETIPLGSYGAVPIGEGWGGATTNLVTVTSALFNTGLQSLELQSGQITNVLSTTNNHDYTLSFASIQDASAPGPGAQVILNGQLVGYVSDTATWQTNSFKFSATQIGTPLMIEPLFATNSGVVLDTFTLTDLGATPFVLPEQPMDPLVGQNPYGEWQLEILDNRAGAMNPEPMLLSWQLSFILQDSVPVPPILPPVTPQTNIVAAGQIAYFTVDVPAWANFATNWLISASAPVNLLFNQTQQPTNAIPPSYNLVSGTSGIATLSATTVPPLIPGSTYYLGVQNLNATPVTFVLEVDFDITPLSNSVPVTSTLNAGPLPRYFYYDASSNATALSFQLTNLTGNVNLVARRGPPLPTLTDYDYGSFNPGTDNEEILLLPNADPPVVLSPGHWYLGVFNADTNPVTYTIVAIEYTNVFPQIIMLANGILYANTNSGVGSTNDYYEFIVSTNAVRAQFEIDNPTANMALVARKGLPLPDLTTYDFISANPGANNDLIVVYDFSSPVPLTPGDWFLTAVNMSGAPVSYSIMATEFSTHWTNLVITGYNYSSNSFCVTWTSEPGANYYVQGRADFGNTNWVIVSPTITATAPFTTWCIPLPSPFHFFRVAEGVAVPPPQPPVLLYGITVTNINIGTNAIVYYTVNVPAWANFASNYLVSASGPVNLLFNQTGLPTGVGVDDFTLLTNSTAGLSVLSAGSAPPLYPRLPYYLGVQNTNTTTNVVVALEVDFGPPVQITGITIGLGGVVTLQWTAPLGSQFEVQWTVSLTPPASWSTVPGVITSTNTQFSFLDDGTQTGGLGGVKFYRLIQLP